MSKVISRIAAVALIIISAVLSAVSIAGLFAFNEGDFPGTLIFVTCCIGLLVASVWLIRGTPVPARVVQVLSLVAYLSIFVTPGLRKDIRIYALEVGALFLIVAGLAQVAIVRAPPDRDSV